MRISVILDENVVRLIESEQQRTGASVDEVVNAAIRGVLTPKPFLRRADPGEISPREIAAPRLSQ